MVICDGFNKMKMKENENGSKSNINLPFPTPPVTATKEGSYNRKYCMISLISFYFLWLDEELKIKTNKLILNANYDNLRNIDSDDSMITSPERSSNLAIKNRLNEGMVKQATFNATEKNISNIMKQKNSITTSASEIIDRSTVTNGKVCNIFRFIVVTHFEFNSFLNRLMQMIQYVVSKIKWNFLKQLKRENPRLSVIKNFKINLVLFSIFQF